MNIKKMTIVLIAVGLCAGCNIVGFLASPSAHERKVPAEFRLKSRAADGLLIFVDTAAGLSVPPEMQRQQSEMLRAFLIKRVGINEKYLVSHDRLSRLRTERDDFSRLSPVQVARMLDAGLVLYVLIEDYTLYGMVRRGYYNGSLATRNILFDAASGQVLWPKTSSGKVVGARVEVETAGYDATVVRLVKAMAHGITKNFYDCPKDQFRVPDEQMDYLTVGQ